MSHLTPIEKKKEVYVRIDRGEKEILNCKKNLADKLVKPSQISFTGC